MIPSSSGRNRVSGTLASKSASVAPASARSDRLVQAVAAHHAATAYETSSRARSRLNRAVLVPVRVVPFVWGGVPEVRVLGSTRLTEWDLAVHPRLRGRKVT